MAGKADARLALVVLAALVASAGCLSGLGAGPSPELRERWVSNTESDVAGNHHAAAAGRVDGQPVVYVPIGGRRGKRGCGLVALDGAGEQRWRHDVPPANCTIHAVADPTLADVDRDGRPEVLATTTERAVFAFAPLSGDVEYRQELTAYGYTHPVLGDVTGDDRPELVVSDVDGTLFVFRANGSVVWRRALGAYSWAHPAVADFDGDDRPELVVGLGDGRVMALDDRGRVQWNRSGVGSVTWMTTRGHGHGHANERGHGHGDSGTKTEREHEGGTRAHGGTQAEGDTLPDVVVATSEGGVVALGGGDGAVAWRHDLGALAAVGAYGDADGDGRQEVYATARDARLRAIDAATGEVEWTTALTDRAVQMTPPPVAGDVDGDGDAELVVATNDGRVLVVAPGDGRVLASYRRDAAVYTHATLADTDGDGTDEIYVTYGDGRVVALAFLV